MRGALVSRVLSFKAQGIIPADAGSTRSSGAHQPTNPDHPRGCGEHSRVFWRESIRAGSSPRMRGARSDHIGGLAWLRIIPADAGSTQGGSVHFDGAADHPRGCGEHPSSHHAQHFVAGSSPRMRGAQTIPGDDDIPVWIIPADAGSTTASASTADGMKDHPRGCGEHAKMDRICTSAEGSSPRMRGAPRAVASQAVVGRIIPADAGSTPLLTQGWASPGDHPRGCGEHCLLSHSVSAQWGSSPRMRGAPSDCCWFSSHPGIIPADAGSTRHRT